jgi:hypothetical protein
MKLRFAFWILSICTLCGGFVHGANYDLETEEEYSLCLEPQYPMCVRIYDKQPPFHLLKVVQEEGLGHVFKEHRHLVMPNIRFMRDDFILNHANPNFFEIRTNQGMPLKIYVFETRHTWPLELIPPHIRGFILQISEEESSVLISETGEGYDDGERVKKEEVFKNPGLYLNSLQIENAMEDYRASYAQYYSDSEEWERVCQKEREKYENWPQFLDNEVKEYLEGLLPQGIELRKINPETLGLFLKLKLKLKESKNFSPVIRLELDEQIEGLFENSGKKKSCVSGPI